MLRRNSSFLEAVIAPVTNDFETFSSVAIQRGDMPCEVNSMIFS